MTERYGSTGRLLIVDLTRGTWEQRETPDEGGAALGGRSLGAALAWEMLSSEVGPLDPENPLMFLAGPLAGTRAPAAGRVTICAVAPQGYPVPWFSRASMGGNVGHHIKYAGYDGVVFLGRAPHPVYLLIQDDQIALRDARDLWGWGIMDTQAELKARHGSRAQIATIGGAGENLSSIATVGTNEGSAAGQGGFGAVMGSKNLKALVVIGTGRPRLYDPDGFHELVKGITQEFVQDSEKRAMRPPSRAPRYGQRRVHCSTGCIRACAMRFEGVPGTLFPEKDYAGIVQCTSGRFSGAEGHYWNLGFEAGFELNMLANDWGINHWDLMKGLFPWIGMCYRAGLMSDLDGRSIELDESRFWYDVLYAIKTHAGPMAELVGDGGRRAIARTGFLPEDARQLYTGWGYANHWDGRGPRGNQIPYPFWLVSALLWMIETRDPMGSTHGYVQDMLRVSPFGQGTLSWEQLMGIGERVYGRPEAMDPLSAYAGKAEPALWHLQRSVIKDSLPLCDRVFPRLFTSLEDDGLPRVVGLEGPDFEARLYSLATGQSLDTEGLHQLAESALTLERAQQMRDWDRTRALDDTVLDFFCETTEEHPNPLLGERKRAEKAPLVALASEFYALRGWDLETGNPD